MTKTKRFRFVIMLIAAVLVLSSCSSASKKLSEDDEVTIVYARGVDVTNGTKKLIEAFEQSHPNINIKYREMPAAAGAQHDQYVTAFSAKSSNIDVFAGDVIWPAEFAQANYILGLDRFIKRDGINMNKYFDAAVDAVTFSGRVWAMPMNIDVGLLYYRSDIVQDAPKTWDELLQKAKKLQGKGGTKFGYVMQANQYEGLVCNAMEFIAAYGGKVINENGEVVVDSPDAIQGIKKMVEIVQSDVVPGNILSFTELETERAFIGGETVFARNWPYMRASASDKKRSEVAGDFSISLLPKGDERSAATLGGYVSMINRYTEHPEAAWEFVKFMTGRQGQLISAEYGGLTPTLKSLFNEQELLELSPLYRNEKFVKALKNAVARPVTPHYAEISDIMQIELSKALAGKISPKQAAKNMQRKMQAVLNTEE